MRGDFAGIDRIDRIAPPLQADFAQRRLAHDLAYARKLDVEGKERKKMRARRIGCKEAGKKTVFVARTNEAKAVRVGLISRRLVPPLRAAQPRQRS